jgi:hypothetical protein
MKKDAAALFAAMNRHGSLQTRIGRTTTGSPWL